MFELLYHILEHLDGERGGHAIVAYRYAQPFKLFCLRFIR